MSRAPPFPCGAGRGGPPRWGDAPLAAPAGPGHWVGPHLAAAVHGSPADVRHPPSAPGPFAQPVGAAMRSTKLTVAWLDLRNAALSVTRRGWPVVPGTFLGADRHWRGREGTSRRRHRGSLLLRCRAFSSLSSRRFIPAHLTFHAKAVDQAHVASVPDTTWPINGHPPGSSRTHAIAPVTTPVSTFSAAKRVVVPWRLSMSATLGRSRPCAGRSWRA
jgi:hypothetical protein